LINKEEEVSKEEENKIEGGDKPTRIRRVARNENVIKKK
jgi:hypothetical protein